MPKKQEISFQEAVNLIHDKRMEAYWKGLIGYEPGEYLWYTRNFVQYISDLGFHIRITGEEFEAYCIQNEVI